MPQLMPLNWIMSIFMFSIILFSMCWIFSVKKEMKTLSLESKIKLNYTSWFW